ncbi:MAG TPA: DUF1549 and DUF1553 domain-containing protein [Pirellulales bacterium]|nr:DUF1549 and DUF1553 domain-containing protein [Pirellulales bacterium]
MSLLGRWLRRMRLAVASLAIIVAARAARSDEAPGQLHEAPITPADRDHWGYRRLSRPHPPQAGGNGADPIDRFLLARLEQAGLAPLPAADRRTLLRRVTFDLTGLPPRPDEIQEFLADGAPGAYERVVDRLLAAPAYGARWAQHWLDLARFAETDGFEHDLVRKDAWRYRDWVIEALNGDMPLDEFISLQIAGDELRPNEPQAAVATGFLLAGPDMPDINLAEERRHMALNEITSTIGTALLGLQVGCAQCHDHKFDPISQADFYRLRAIFESADLFKPSPAGRVVQESGTVPVSHLLIRGDFRRPGPIVEAAFPRIANASGEVPANGPQTAASGSEVPSSGSGRRAELARWLTSGRQPLTPRVLANWIWQHHFGKGLSRTPGDFGILGDSPSHPELLDWLATELIERGWSLKQMHRLLVTSAAYRRSSRPTSSSWKANETDPAETAAVQTLWQSAVQADPQNRWLARMNGRRLEGEAVRDAMLAAAATLSQGHGGPGIMAPLPAELVATLLPGQWKASANEEEIHRRSVYLFVRRNLPYPLFEVLDRAETTVSCPRRNVSTTAPQALALLNSDLSLAAARELATYLAGQHPLDVAAQIDLLYERTLGRQPTASERSSAAAFLSSTSLRSEAADAAAPPAALVELCLAMFNLNEFIYVD